MKLHSPMVADSCAEVCSSDIASAVSDRPFQVAASIAHFGLQAGVGDEKTSTLPQEIPSPFGRYRLLGILGKGGMGSVYLAEDTQLGRTVALKIPHPAGNSAQIAARFQREAQAAATVTHPNICPLYDVGEANGLPYLIMAYIEGTPLSAVMEASPRAGVEAAVVLVRKLALAMHEAHQRGVIHRDLKPANVLIDRRGEPIITDFGIAWLRRTSGTPTLPGTAWGTPAYMAPEVLIGKAEVGCPACDVYALGVILYELLTGRIPFTGDPSAVLTQIQLGTPLAPSLLRPDIPPRLEAICLKAMARNVADRFATMAELATELANSVGHAEKSDTEVIAEASSRREPDKTEAAIVPAPIPADVPPDHDRRRSKRRFRSLWAIGLAGSSAVLLGLVFSWFDASPGYGTIRIRVSDTEVERETNIDGNRLSKEHSSNPQRLEAGTHWLQVKGKDREPVNVVFRVEKGQNSMVYVELPALPSNRPVETPVVIKEKQALAMPQPQSPKDQTVFEVFPRDTTLTWSAVPGAVFYRVEIQMTAPFAGVEWYDHPLAVGESRETDDTSYKFHFAGTQPGRWRVCAVDEFGHEGPKSLWRHFEYRR